MQAVEGHWDNLKGFGIELEIGMNKRGISVSEAVHTAAQMIASVHSTVQRNLGRSTEVRLAAGRTTDALSIWRGEWQGGIA